MLNILFGTFDRLLDEKNRLSLPSKLVKKLSSTVYAMNGHNNVMYLYSEEFFLQECERTMKLNRDKKMARDISLFRSSDVTEFEIDNVNRIHLDVSTMKRYNFKKEVTIIGNYDHLEIWNTEDWNKYHEEISRNYDKNTEEYLNDEQ